MPTDIETRLAALADREDIFDLVRRERFARDQWHYDVMRDCLHDEAHIRSSWFDGEAEDYVAATRARFSSENAGNSKHWVFPGFLMQNGDKATVESPATIMNRIVIGGVEVDFLVYARFFSRVLRREGVWRLLSFEVIFERDTLTCVNPKDELPIDWALLKTYRPSYQFLTYVQEVRGTRVNPNLYGDDRRDDVLAYYASEKAWLMAD